MRRINIAQITALLLAANAMALAAPHRRSFTGRPTGQVHGTVIDTDGPGSSCAVPSTIINQHDPQLYPHTVSDR